MCGIAGCIRQRDACPILIKELKRIESLELLVATISLQLLAYHISNCKGQDIDQLHNLAKLVTVE